MTQPITKINESTYEHKFNHGRVEFGAKDHPDFIPEVKLYAWDDEVDCRVRLSDTPATNISEKDGKVKGKHFLGDVQFYPIEADKDHPEGGFEFEVIFSARPAFDVLEFKIEKKGLAFYYQPDLTIDELRRGALRPDNVVGSYAVYHESKKNNKYKTGKAFHIYRPKLIDAEGNEIWAVLNIDENAGKLTISMDTAWLDNAIYPVIVDPTFGYTSVGGSIITFQGIRTVYVTCPEAATVTSISAYHDNWSALQYAYGIYEKTGDYASADPLVATSSTGSGGSFNEAWHSLPITASITAGDYQLAILLESGSDTYFNYDGVGSECGKYSTNISYPNWPDPLPASNESQLRLSIYAVYETGGTPVSITAVTATESESSLTPTISTPTPVEIIVPLTSETATLLTPSILACLCATVIPPPAEETESALVPSIETGQTVSITTPVIPETDAALTPSVQADKAVNIAVPLITETDIAQAPKIQASQSVVVSVPLSPETEAALTPSVSSAVNITIPLSAETETALIPGITAADTAQIEAPTAQESESAPVPSVQANTGIIVPIPAIEVDVALYPEPAEYSFDTGFEYDNPFNVSDMPVMERRFGYPYAFTASYGLHCNGEGTYSQALRGTEIINPDDYGVYTQYQVMVNLLDTEALAGIAFCAQETLDGRGYQVVLEDRSLPAYNNQPAVLFKVDCETVEYFNCADIELDSFIRLKVSHYPNGDISIELESPGGTALMSASTSDTTYRQGRYGVCVYGNATFDDYSVLAEALTIPVEVNAVLATETEAALAPTVTANIAASVVVPLTSETEVLLTPEILACLSATVIPPPGEETEEALAPDIAGNVAVNITCPAMAETEETLAPSLTAGIEINVPVTTESEESLTPGVAAGVSVSVPLTTETDESLCPGISAGANITVPGMTESETAPEPVIESAGAVTIQAPVVAEAEEALTPGVTAEYAVEITVPMAGETESGLVPGVAIGVNAEVSVPTVEETEDALIPSVISAISISISATTGTEAEGMLTPGVAAARAVEVTSPVMAESEAANSPEIAAGIGVGITVPLVVESDALLLPDITAYRAVEIAVPLAVETEEMYYPSIGTGSAYIVVPLLSETDIVPLPSVVAITPDIRAEFDITESIEAEFDITVEIEGEV